ncbi:MAG: DUF4416 family protein [Candidatus Neomarinimicrobiota bacterium]|nr:DUF4416 family protein [Candidatus Neomarinimicrobiota bacterium]
MPEQNIPYLYLMDVKTVQPVKLVMGIILAAQEDPAVFTLHLQRVFGKQDFQSPAYAFDLTDYYAPEMGAGLIRIFTAYQKLIEPDDLAEIKRLCNVIEQHFALAGKRVVNLDPGYLDLDKFVLASAKYGRQKICLGKGIYADPTLYYFDKSFHAHEWSFPDFKSGRYDADFLTLRQRYKQQLRLR